MSTEPGLRAHFAALACAARAPQSLPTSTLLAITAALASAPDDEALGALLADIFVLPRLYPWLHLGLAAFAVLGAAASGATAWPPRLARFGWPTASVAASR